MIDPEVARLRRLRDAALRARAIARALLAAREGPEDPLLERAGCVSWRVARAATGRLIAHPYPSYQRGPTLHTVVLHALGARYTALVRRSQRLAACRAELLGLHRIVDDVRALTLAPDLSETLGRSQWELTTLLETVERASASGVADAAARPVLPKRSAEIAAPGALEGDWPYLAL